MIKTDSAYRIGSTHKVCQDYATHGEVWGNNYIIVADGCSSSPETDFGARLLAKSAIWRSPGAKQYPQSVIEKAASHCVSLGLSLQCLDSTLLIAVQAKEVVYIRMFGDGALGIVDKNGETKIYTVSFPSGAPLYPSYLLSVDRLKSYEDSFGLNQVIDTYTGDVGKREIRSDVSWLSLDIPVNDLKLVTLMSDGIFTFKGKDAVKDAMAFKSFNGEFVSRRMNRLLKDYSADGVVNTDDVSIAAMYFFGEPT